jgi:hypothetical protein
MKILDVIKKYGTATLVTAITFDSYRRQVYSHKLDIKKISEANRQLMQQKSDALMASEIQNENIKNHITSETTRLSEISKIKIDHSNKLETFNDILKSNNFPDGITKENISTHKTYLQQEIAKLDTQIKEGIIKMNDYIENVGKNDLFSLRGGWIYDLLENYQNFLSTLNTDQIVAIINLLGFGMILMTLFNIGVLILGDVIINKFKLESKFPRIAKYIEIRSKVKTIYIRLYYIIMLIIVLVWISINLYIFFLHYFL